MSSDHLSCLLTRYHDGSISLPQFAEQLGDIFRLPQVRLTAGSLWRSSLSAPLLSLLVSDNVSDSGWAARAIGNMVADNASNRSLVVQTDGLIEALVAVAADSSSAFAARNGLGALSNLVVDNAEAQTEVLAALGRIARGKNAEIEEKEVLAMMMRLLENLSEASGFTKRVVEEQVLQRVLGADRVRNDLLEAMERLPRIVAAMDGEAVHVLLEAEAHNVLKRMLRLEEHGDVETVEEVLLCIQQILRKNEFEPFVADMNCEKDILQIAMLEADDSSGQDKLVLIALRTLVGFSTHAEFAQKLIDHGVLELMNYFGCRMGERRALALIISGNLGHNTKIVDYLIHEKSYLSDLVKIIGASDDMQEIQLVLSAFRNITLFSSAEEKLLECGLVNILFKYVQTEIPSKDFSSPEAQIVMHCVVCLRNLTRSEAAKGLIVMYKDHQGIPILKACHDRNEAESIRYEISRMVCYLSSFSGALSTLFDIKSWILANELLETTFSILHEEAGLLIQNMSSSSLCVGDSETHIAASIIKLLQSNFAKAKYLGIKAFFNFPEGKGKTAVFDFLLGQQDLLQKDILQREDIKPTELAEYENLVQQLFEFSIKK